MHFNRFDHIGVYCKHTSGLDIVREVPPEKTVAKKWLKIPQGKNKNYSKKFFGVNICLSFNNVSLWSVSLSAVFFFYSEEAWYLNSGKTNLFLCVLHIRSHRLMWWLLHNENHDRNANIIYACWKNSNLKSCSARCETVRLIFWHSTDYRSLLRELVGESLKRASIDFKLPLPHCALNPCSLLLS